MVGWLVGRLWNYRILTMCTVLMCMGANLQKRITFRNIKCEITKVNITQIIASIYYDVCISGSLPRFLFSLTHMNTHKIRQIRISFTTRLIENNLFSHNTIL